MNAELTRLEHSLSSIKPDSLPEGLRGLVRDNRSAILLARHASAPELRLYRMRGAFVGTEALLFYAAHPAQAHDIRSFNDLWAARRPSFGRVRVDQRGTRLERALSEAAGNRAAKLFTASLPYARTDSPGNGLYYLAEAEGNLSFQKFIDSLRSAEKPLEPGLPPSGNLDSAFQGLESDAVATFEREGNSAIPSSVRLKEGRELLDQNLMDGATLTLLETRYELGKLEKSNVALQGQPAPSSHSDSMAALWSAVAIEKPDQARSIRAGVLPLYQSLFRPGKARAIARAPVTVTLVRWPYT